MIVQARDPEEKFLLDRLEGRQTIYVVRPAGIAAAQALALRGEVRCVWGDGKDAGVLLVEKAAVGRPTPRGGDAA